MKRILIVDDQSVIRWMIRLALRDNFTVDEADNEQAAWGRIKKQRPDGIVLDVLMPGSMDGFQFCERIKRDPDLASSSTCWSPPVVITAIKIAVAPSGRTATSSNPSVRWRWPITLWWP